MKFEIPTHIPTDYNKNINGLRLLIWRTIFFVENCLSLVQQLMMDDSISNEKLCLPF